MTPRRARRIVLRAEGVTKSYGSGPARHLALAGVDLDVAEGELVALTGASGSGKTTLLHCLAGLAPVDAGRVEVDGVEVTALDDDARSDLRLRTLGLVFQGSGLVGALTVAENVELPMLAAGVAATDVRRRRADALAAVGLDPASGDRLPASLSGGEQQRVALARAITNEPRVVLADEPTAALDSGSAGALVALLRGLTGSGVAVVVATHSEEIAATADRRVVLADGVVAR